MKTSLKTSLVVMVVVLALAVFTACGIDPQPTTPPACEHAGGEATCQNAAVCEKCGESYGEKLAHSVVVREAEEATCTEEGITEGSFCSECGEVFAAQEVIPALGHVDGDDNDHICDRDNCNEVVTECEAGEGSHNCATCGNTLTECAAAENSHNCEICGKEWSECKAAENSHNCAVCGKEWSKHSYDNDCDTDCNVCGETRETTHQEEILPGRAATCTEAGLTEGKKCSVCDEILVAQTGIPANGHSDNDSNYECDVCKTPLCTDHEEEIIPAVPATCTTTGLSAGKKCAKCGHIIVAQEVTPALEHSYVVTYEWSADNSTCTAKKVCTNDASHIAATETATVRTVKLDVTATKVTYTYAVEFANDEFSAHTKAVEADITLENSIATINAPVVAGRVASHDYVKFPFFDAEATYTFTIYYSEVDVWDGISVSTSLAGKGTADEPYLIQSGADLAYIAEVVNALAVKTAAFSGNYFVMTKSIDLNGHTLHIGTGSGWGTRQIFAGYLDGNNCSIRGINNTLSLFGCVEGGWAKNLSLYGNVEVAQGNDSVGVFVGYLRLAPLENITNYANINGRGNVGGLVGNMEQSTDTPSTNLVNYGTVTGVQNVGGIAGLLGRTLTNSTNWGAVSGNNSIGGIVANLYWACNVTNCANYGTVSGTTDVGGVAGNRNGTINAVLSNCTNNGNVVGTTCASSGIDGISPADVTKSDCVNYGKVEISAHEMTHTDAKDATCEEAGNVAYDYCSVCKQYYDADGKVIADVVVPAKGHSWDNGVVVDGKITFTCQNDTSHTRVENAKYTVTVNHLYLDGSEASATEALEFAFDEIATINAKTIEGYVGSHDYVKVHVLNNETITIYYSEVDVWDGTSVSTSLAGKGTADEPFLIQSAADFAYFASVINAVEGAAGVNYKVTTFKGQYFKMTKSIDLNGHSLIVGMHAGWNNYQGFFGHFDGNNCSIRGINIDNSTGTTSTALFGCINAGSLKNLSVYGNVKGNKTTGGLVAYTVTNAVLENITSYINVTSVKSGSNQGTVAGIVANQENSAGALLNCVNYGTVTCDSYIVGGIAGSGGKDITNCVNWGDVTGANVSVGGISGTTKDKGTISGCVNYGTVTGATTAYGQIGGIVGTCNKPVNNCVNYGTVIGTTSKGVSGICGTTSSTVTDCVDNGTIQEYVPAE